MSKVILTIFLTLMVSSFAMELSEVQALLNQDQCATQVMNLFESDIEAVANKLKQVSI